MDQTIWSSKNEITEKAVKMLPSHEHIDAIIAQMESDVPDYSGTYRPA